MLRRLVQWMVGLVLLAAVSSAAAQPAGAPKAGAATALSNWAAVFISGDYRAHSGAPSEVFDNGRRDMGLAFVAAGLKSENVVHFSPMDRLHARSPEKPQPLSAQNLLSEMRRVSAQATGGCLFFLTSHGLPGMAVMGEAILDPGGLDQLLDLACPDRPTVVIVSSCYSGSFIPEVAAPNRMVMTAARDDRSSFGCGEEDVHTFFDGCLLEALPKVQTFDALAETTKACVTRREGEMKMSPPSEPQVSVGAQIAPLLPTLRFAARSP